MKLDTVTSFPGGAARFVVGAALAMVIMFITDTQLHWPYWASAITVAVLVFATAKFVERHRDSEDAP